MILFTNFTKSSIGAKAVMAVSGLVLFGYVLAHMAGNLQIFLGQEAFNSYAAFIKGTKALLWGVRIVFGLAIIAHIWSGIRLTALNKSARPVRYKKTPSYQASTFMSRTMIVSGLTLFFFVAYHLAHFTLGITHPEHFNRVDALGRHDAYTMFVLGFQQVEVMSLYVIAMVFLGFHLNHGAFSMFQSLGLNNPMYEPKLKLVSRSLAALIVIGNITMPIAVFTHLIKLPPGVS